MNMAENFDESDINVPSEGLSRRSFVSRTGVMVFIAVIADVARTSVAGVPCGNGVYDASCWKPSDPYPAHQDGNCGRDIFKNNIDAACDQPSSLGQTFVKDNSCGPVQGTVPRSDMSCQSPKLPSGYNSDNNSL
jgi:hypothetical protein